MSRLEDRYKDTEIEHTSQIRSIIGKINEEKPSQEKSRELKQRSDGSKEVRVVRRRRVTISEKDKRKRAVYSFLRSSFFAIIFVVLSIAYFLYQFFMMSGTAYLNEQSEKLKEAWGLQSLEISGASISGFELHVESLVIKFADHSMLSKLELHELRADLSVLGIIRNMLMADELYVEKADLFFKEGVDKLSMDKVADIDFCQFNRISCPRFSLYFGSIDSSPIAIRNASAYIYKIKQQSVDATLDVASQLSCSLSSGKFIVKGWKQFSIDNILMRVSSTGVDSLHATLTLPEYTSSHFGKKQAVVKLKTSIANGVSLFGPYDFTSTDMSFDDISANRLTSFLSARIVDGEDSGDASDELKRKLSFSADGGDPSFTGSFHLEDITWKGLPAISHLLKHMESDRRAEYVKIFISKAQVEMNSTKDKLELSFTKDQMNERYLASLEASIKINAENEISGFINYGIPLELTRVEYSDGISDPIFREDNKLAWLETRLSGKGSYVQDNSNHLDEQAKVARQSRPVPADLNRVNVNIVSKAMMENFNKRRKATSGAGSMSSSEILNPIVPEKAPSPSNIQKVENTDEVLMPLSPSIF